MGGYDSHVVTWRKWKRCQISKRYYKRHKEQIRKNKKQYCERHKEQIGGYNKQYREQNKEQLKLQWKRYHEQNKERRNLYSKQWYAQNKDKAKQYYEQNREHYEQYRKENREREKSRTKQWYAQNKDKAKRYREQNKERRKQHSKQYYEQNPEYFKQYRKQYRVSDAGRVSFERQFAKLARPFNMDIKQTKYALLSWGNHIKKNPCAVCNGTAKEAHHILYKKHYPLLMFNWNNGIPLCRRCHYEVHGKNLDKIKPLPVMLDIRTTHP